MKVWCERCCRLIVQSQAEAKLSWRECQFHATAKQHPSHPISSPFPSLRTRLKDGLLTALHISLRHLPRHHSFPPEGRLLQRRPPRTALHPLAENLRRAFCSQLHIGDPRARRTLISRAHNTDRESDAWRGVLRHYTSRGREWEIACVREKSWIYTRLYIGTICTTESIASV